MIEPYLKRVVAGDTDAFRFVIEHYKQMVFAVAIQIVRDNHLAEDVVQETFFKAYKNIKKFKRNSKFSTWLYRIAVNESLTMVKHSWYEEKPSDSEQKQMPVPEELLHDVLENKDRNKIIKAVLLQLKPKESLVLQLFYLQEQSVAEVAKIVGIKKDHVKVLLSRARKSFYNILRKQYANELSIL